MNSAAGPEGSSRLAYGVVFMMGASALVAATTLFAKTLGLDGMHPLQISAGRFAFALLSLLLLIILRPSVRPTWRGARWQWHAARSLCGWLGVSCMFAAVALMPLAEATALSFVSPVVTMALTVVFLKELFGRRHAIAVALAIAGALMIIRPGTDAFQVAALLALAAAFFMGAEGLFIKKLSDTEPPLRILLINNMIGAVLAISAALFIWQMPTAEQWMLMAGLGVVMVVAQTCFILSMKRAPATYVMPAFYSTLVFSTVYDILFFAIFPPVLTWVGAGSIVAGALFLAFGRR